MHISAETNTSQTGFRLSASVDEYTDGQPPIGALSVDTVVQNLSAGRLAVAGCLIFQDYIGHEVTLKNEVPRMAQHAIMDFFGERRVVTHPVTDVPASVWPASGTLFVQTYGDAPDNPSVPPHDYHVQVADGTVYNGAFSSARRLIVASNAALISRLAGQRVPMDCLHVAIGVLLSQDLHLRDIHVVSSGDRVLLERCRLLLRSVELNLSWTERDSSL